MCKAFIYEDFGITEGQWNIIIAPSIFPLIEGRDSRVLIIVQDNDGLNR